jgi:hypothetical protein
MTPLRRDDADDGTAIAELVILIVVFFGFIAAIVFAGRMTVGSAHVEAAARSAARSISIARDPDGAMAEAKAEAAKTAGLGSPMCRSMNFYPLIDPSRDPVTVTVDITCVVDLSELSLIQVPGTMTVSASAVEVIDRYREGTS